MRKEYKVLKKCIICNSKLKKLFEIENMPASAQDIPDRTELDKDVPVDIRLCACTGCGLVQLDAQPVHYFRDVIRAGGGSSTMENLRLRQYKEFIEIGDLEGKKILEAGCGAGEFLEILARFPVKAFGMEHKEELVKKAEEKGLKVSINYPESEDEIFENAPFDAFCSFNFLEHQPKPLTYLKAIAHNLTEGGYGLITVPSFEYILKEKSFYEIIPDHIAYYTFESLSFALQGAGFEIIKQDTVNRDTIAMIVRKRALPDVGGILHQKEEIAQEIREILEEAKKEKKKVAIWGASHQGFTLSSTLLSSTHSIQYIIDSAKFKQGKFAPASHIPIVSLEYAKKHPADIIIIVAPGYSEEIAKIIIKEFCKDTKIYTMMSEKLRKVR